MSYREALTEALRTALRDDDRVIVLGQDVGARGGAYGVTTGLWEEFGAQRVRDAPSAEAALVGVGIGAAMAGMRPVVELTTAAFAALALDQLVHHAAPLRTLSGGQLSAPLVLRMPQGAGARLGPVHSANIEGLLHHIPGLLVWAPSTPADAHAMLAAAIRSEDPVVLLEHTALYDTRGEVDGAGSAPGAVVRRAGADVTITASSRMTVLALEAAEILSCEHGVEADVLDLRTLRPLDEAAVAASAARTGRVVLVEEGWPAGGVTATLAASLPLGTPTTRVTGADAFTPYAAALEQEALPDAAAIVAAALGTAPRRAETTATATATPAGPTQTISAEVDLESLVVARRATGTSLAQLLATAATPLLDAHGDAVVLADGDVLLLGSPAPGPPSATLTLGPVTTRPRAYDGAVTIRHLAPLTLRIASTTDARALLNALRERLERPPD
jgi:pyruvate dehydrogenase E1 component beta subunit